MFRFLRCFLTRRFWIRGAFVALALLTLLVVIYCEEKWRGQRAWNAYVAAAESRGTKLWPENFAQPDVPDADNYAALPCIREVEAAQLEKREAHPGLPAMTDANRLSAMRDDVLGTPLPLKEARDFFVTNGEIPQPSADPAQDLLELFVRKAPALQQLREASSRRQTKFARFWGGGVDPNRVMATFLLNSARLFRLSACARLIKGDVDGAASEIRHLARLCAAVRSEPGLLSGMMGTWVAQILACAVSDGVASGQWTDEQLQEFTETLRAVDSLADMRFAVSAERAFLNLEYERMAQHGYVSPFPQFKEPWMTKVGMAFYPSGWARQNMVKTNEFFDFLLQEFATAEGGTPRPLSLIPPRDWEEKHLGYSLVSRMYWGFTHSTVYLLGGIEMGWTYSQSHLAQAQLACALERYERRHGHYPESLALLVPDFLPDVPGPLVDTLRISYQRISEKEYVLWEHNAGAPVPVGAMVSEETLKSAEWVWRSPKR